MTFSIIVQARMGSSRLPGKVLKKINDMPMIEIILKRLSLSRKVDNIILATSEKQQDIFLSKFVKELGFEVFKGSENDVLSRYYWASKYYDLKNIIRITGDCPLVDPNIIDEMCNEFSRNNPDYLSNIFPRSFPKGLDIEIFSFKSLERAFNETQESSHREHVTPYIRESGKFITSNFDNDNDYSSLRWTVDYKEDFDLIKYIFNKFEDNIHFNWKDVLDLEKKEPKIFDSNKHLK